MRLKYYLFFLILLIMPSFYVNAEDVPVTSGTDINIRELPSTVSGILDTIEHSGTRISIINDNAGMGAGCDDKWYYINYNNINGYVCSTYVKIVPLNLTITFGRPWTSPKKAIVGGAEFINTNYISAGKFSPYLKKFNVKPGAYGYPYTYQYMANLRAPMSESWVIHNSLSKNNLLNVAYNFAIPIFNDMPENTFSANISNIIRHEADVQGTEFEQSISGFPETYKPYLRYLHTKYPTWTFTPLMTNLDFVKSVIAQKPRCSIEISTNLCEQNPYYQTETDWCIARDDVVSFFLDPRNFLNETYIFMFENVNYSDIYTEAAVEVIIKGTYMDGLSILDNQKYSSIFMEAGQRHNVSPVYLAALAIIESGSHAVAPFNVSGDEFEYKGYTYSGLYNIFNVGANSSEANPTKAGLVYANGGQGPNQGAIIGPAIMNFLNLLSVSRYQTYIKGYQPGTNINQIKNQVGDKATVIIRDSDGRLKESNELIGTGNKIEISSEEDSEIFTYVMLGDLNGDGEINSADLLLIRQHLLGQNILNGAHLSSALLSGNKEVNSADLLKIRQHLLGINKIEQ